jgi:ectoine hydroxylase-related dioxygenase (phytanoyl-CoA dioxygenase family)
VLASEPRFDKGIAEEHPSELYRPVAFARGAAGFDAVGPAEIASFHEQGYLVIDDAFSPEEVGQTLSGLLDLIDGQNPAFQGLQFEAAARGALATLTPEQKQDYVRKVDLFAAYDRRLERFVRHPRLLDVVSRIYGEPAELYYDQALLKPPRVGREKPWHQDNSMFDHAPDARIVGVWTALDEVTLENGCMHVIPGSHRAGPVPHFQRRDFQICDAEVPLDRIVAVPLRPGGCLLFDGLLHHGTPSNRSPKRRRATQCWYVPARGVTPMDAEARKAAWGGEAQGKKC